MTSPKDVMYAIILIIYVFLKSRYPKVVKVTIIKLNRNIRLRWLPTIPENVKLLRTHSPVAKFILNTPKTGQCEYFQEKHEGHYYTYNEK